MFEAYGKNGAGIVRMRVRMYDTMLVPVSGIVGSSTQCTLLNAAGSTTQLVLDSTYFWSEITAGAFSGQGIYLLTIPSSVFNTTGLGEHTVAVKSSTASAVNQFTYWEMLPSNNVTYTTLMAQYQTHKAVLSLANPSVATFTIYNAAGTSSLRKFITRDSNNNVAITNIKKRTVS